MHASAKRDLLKCTAPSMIWVQPLRRLSTHALTRHAIETSAHRAHLLARHQPDHPPTAAAHRSPPRSPTHRRGHPPTAAAPHPPPQPPTTAAPHSPPWPQPPQPPTHRRSPPPTATVTHPPLRPPTHRRGPPPLRSPSHRPPPTVAATYPPPQPPTHQRGYPAANFVTAAIACASAPTPHYFSIMARRNSLRRAIFLLYMMMEDTNMIHKVLINIIIRCIQYAGPAD